jgi:hypothetical protein
VNYAKSRQRLDDGLWDFTFTRDKVTRRTSPCSEECKHATQEEADQHFYDWCLDQVEEIHLANQMLKCRICGEWTDKEFGNRHLGMYFGPIPLCDKHRNKEGLKQAEPFHSPIEIWYS